MRLCRERERSYVKIERCASLPYLRFDNLIRMDSGSELQWHVQAPWWSWCFFENLAR